jgi:hypothetical protein
MPIHQSNLQRIQVEGRPLAGFSMSELVEYQHPVLVRECKQVEKGVYGYL